jgi:hypothetical protein
MSSLWFKFLLTPLLMLLVTWTARRYGPRVGGLLTGLPLVSGPASLFLATGSGETFASRAAPGALAGVTGVAAFCGVYAHASRHSSWPRALAWALAGFLTTATVMQHASRTLGALSLIALTALLAVRLMLGRAPAVQAPKGEERAAAAWELPLRIVLSTGLVVGLTAGSRLLGPALSGIFSCLPLVSAIVAVFTHARGGAAAVRSFLTGVVGGSIGTVGFFLVIGACLKAGVMVQTYAMAVAATFALNAIFGWALRYEGALAFRGFRQKERSSTSSI